MYDTQQEQQQQQQLIKKKLKNLQWNELKIIIPRSHMARPRTDIVH